MHERTYSDFDFAPVDPPRRWNDAALTVLVLDDSAAQRTMLCSLVQKWGHNAIPVAHPNDALKLANDPRIDMILCDWMMPEMTGPEFCRRLRAEILGSYIYVLLLTSKKEEKAVSEGLKAGADDFLSKPLRSHELQARMVAGARIVDMQKRIRKNSKLLENTIDELQDLYAVIDRDLEEARRLQQGQLQDRFRSYRSADVSLLLEASGHVGGDMVGYFSVSRNKIGLYSIDVSGHGVASAMIAARIAGMLSEASPDQNIALSRREDGGFEAQAPDLIAAQLNALFLREVKTDRYFTLCLGFLDLATGKFEMVQAGHPNPIILRQNGTVEMVGSGGMPVGLIEGASFEMGEAKLGPGDKLMLYSDGLTECPSATGDLLDEEGLMRIFQDAKSKTAQDLLAFLRNELVEFAGTDDFPDDISALLVEFSGP